MSNYLALDMLLIDSLNLIPYLRVHKTHVGSGH